MKDPHISASNEPLNLKVFQRSPPQDYYPLIKGRYSRQDCRCPSSSSFRPLRYRESDHNPRLADRHPSRYKSPQSGDSRGYRHMSNRSRSGGRWNYGVDTDDRCHQPRVAVFQQVFRGHPVEGAAFVDHVPESQRNWKHDHAIEL